MFLSLFIFYLFAIKNWTREAVGETRLVHRELGESHSSAFTRSGRKAWIFRETVAGPGPTAFVEAARKHAVKSHKNRKQLCCYSAMLRLFSYSVSSPRADPVQASLPAQGKAGSPRPAPHRQHRPAQRHRLPGPGLQQRLPARSKALRPPSPLVSDLPLLQMYQFFRGSHWPSSPAHQSPQDWLSLGSGSIR